MREQLILTLEGESRVYPMTRLQQRTYESVLRTAMTGLSENAEPEVQSIVHRCVLRCLGGQMPRETDPSHLHQLALAFRHLPPEQFKRLPILGAPNGWLTGVCLVLATGGGVASRLFLFDREQGIAFNDAVEGQCAMYGIDRDTAFLNASNAVGKIVCGMVVPNPVDSSLPAVPGDVHGVLSGLFGPFEPFDEQTAEALPLATAADVRRHGSREPEPQ